MHRPGCRPVARHSQGPANRTPTHLLPAAQAVFCLLLHTLPMAALLLPLPALLSRLGQPADVTRMVGPYILALLPNLWIKAIYRCGGDLDGCQQAANKHAHMQAVLCAGLPLPCFPRHSPQPSFPVPPLPHAGLSTAFWWRNKWCSRRRGSPA